MNEPELPVDSPDSPADSTARPVVSPELLAILRCPVEGGPLAVADRATINRINGAIAAGQQRDFQDQLVTEAMEAGLINAAGTRLYPIRRGIPTLIADEAIRCDQQI